MCRWGTVNKIFHPFQGLTWNINNLKMPTGKKEEFCQNWKKTKKNPKKQQEKI